MAVRSLTLAVFLALANQAVAAEATQPVALPLAKGPTGKPGAINARQLPAESAHAPIYYQMRATKGDDGRIHVTCVGVRNAGVSTKPRTEPPRATEAK